MSEQSNVIFYDVPYSIYTVELVKAELSKSKEDEPMATIWFKVTEGEYKGNVIIMNQIITKGYQIYIVNYVLRSMCEACSCVVAVRFDSYNQYGALLMDISERVSGTFTLEYREGRKGYPIYTVTSAA